MNTPKPIVAPRISTTSGVSQVVVGGQAKFAVRIQLDPDKLDNLSMMALTLAVGFLVDDAIVVLENIVRHMEMGKTRFEAALEGGREIGFTVLSMTLSLTRLYSDSVHERNHRPVVSRICHCHHDGNRAFRNRLVGLTPMICTAYRRIRGPWRLRGDVTRAGNDGTLSQGGGFRAPYARYPGLVDVNSSLQIQSPTVTVDIDRDRAATMGVTADQFRIRSIAPWRAPGFQHLHAHQ
jgi:hypothetical protein